MPIDVSGRKNVAQLKKEGYDVTYHEHEGGHGTPREIVRESIEWFLGKSQDGPSIASFDHLVPVVSEVPSMAGQPATIYLRERVRNDVARAGRAIGSRGVIRSRWRRTGPGGVRSCGRRSQLGRLPGERRV